MLPQLTDFEFITGHTLRLSFANGTTGEIDLAQALVGEIFEPLKDPAYFRQAKVHPELHTLVWPNGADFAPEFLYAKINIPA